MAWTQADIDALKENIKNGGILKRMKFADGEYEFRDLNEMLKLLSIMQADASSGANSYRLAATSKGA